MKNLNLFLISLFINIFASFSQNQESSFDKAWYRLAKYFFKNKKFKKANDYIEKAIRINQEKSKYWKLYLKCASLISTKN